MAQMEKKPHSCRPVKDHRLQNDQTNLCMISIMSLFSASLCQSDWSDYGGRCYMLVRTAASHSDAQDGCRKMAATLATIGNEGENAFLTTL